jgi:hypothetical protein
MYQTSFGILDSSFSLHQEDLHSSIFLVVMGKQAPLNHGTVK